MKIMIIGSSGAGKSTFARELGEILELPVYHLDYYFWKPGWQETPYEEWVDFNKNLVMKDKWIIDGYYGRTVEIRMLAADIIFFFDISPFITTYRVLKRRIQYHGKSRPDLNEGCPESLDWQFIKLGWNFRKTKRPRILEKLNRHAKTSKVIMIQHPKEAKWILNELHTKGSAYFDEIESSV